MYFPYLVWPLLLTLALPAAASAASSDKLDVTVRGRTLTLAIYQPRVGPQRGTVVMGSGDVGWVGLAVSMAETLSEQGYLVIGVNIRQYLASFTSGASHLEVADAPGDFRAIGDVLKERQLLARPVILSGVSEGAALAVLAASDRRNHEWIDGVITMGLPPTAELAWRWTDISAWFTKHDADEPSFAPATVIASVSPLPLFMIQSTRDEYVSQADYQRFLATAREPKQLTLIDASNHRFTDRRQQLRSAYFDGLTWIQQILARGGRT
jgi:alpha-beta hydrolase superfamily lysophospholipase